MLLRIVVAGAVLLSAGIALAQQNVAVEQDQLMKSVARNFYGTLGRTIRGQLPYDQNAIDAALKQLEVDMGKTAAVFATNPKEAVADDTYGSSPKIWQSKADFDAKIPPVSKAIADAKGTVKNADTLKAASTAIEARCNDCHDSFRVKLK